MNREQEKNFIYLVSLMGFNTIFYMVWNLVMNLVFIALTLEQRAMLGWISSIYYYIENGIFLWIVYRIIKTYRENSEYTPKKDWKSLEKKLG